MREENIQLCRRYSYVLKLMKMLQRIVLLAAIVFIGGFFKENKMKYLTIKYAIFLDNDTLFSFYVILYNL